MISLSRYPSTSSFKTNTGTAYIAVLFLLAFLSALALTFIHETNVRMTGTMMRGNSMQAHYLAESAANHAMWRLLHSGDTFPADDDVYYMHSLAGGRYGYKVRRHTKTTFAGITAVGASGDHSTQQSYVLHVTSHLATGVYLGDGYFSQYITGLGFEPGVVIVKGNLSKEAVIKTSTMPTGYSKRMVGGESIQMTRISLLDSDGFTVRYDDRVNKAGVYYYWVAFREISSMMKVGSYTGNGVSSREITGIGFDPALIFVMSEDNKEAVHRSVNYTDTFDFGSGNGITNCVIDPFPSGGFRLGNDDRVNKFGVVYHYVCWAEIDGLQKFSGYVGNNTEDRNITGVGFEPDYVITRGVSTGKDGHHYTASLGGTANSALLFKSDSNQEDRIQGLLTDGFQIGDDDKVNKAGVTYSYFAWSDGY